MGIEEGSFWDEPNTFWVLYGNQLDNKFHILKINKKINKKNKKIKKAMEGRLGGLSQLSV